MSLVVALENCAAAVFIPVYGSPTYSAATSTGYLYPMQSSTGNVVNDGGVAIGTVDKYASGAFVGYRGVKWDASGASASELIVPSGICSTGAVALNNSGSVAGYLANSVSSRAATVMFMRCSSCSCS